MIAQSQRLLTPYSKQAVKRDPENSKSKAAPALWVTTAINVGEPSGQFKTGIPDKAYCPSTRFEFSSSPQRAFAIATAFAEQQFAHEGPGGYGEGARPVVHDGPTPAIAFSGEKLTSKFGQVIELHSNGKQIGYALPSAVCDPIVAKNQDGTYRPVAFMVFKEISRSGVPAFIPKGYLAEDGEDPSVIPEKEHFQGNLHNLSRLGDGNWLIPRPKKKEDDIEANVPLDSGELDEFNAGDEDTSSDSSSKAQDEVLDVSTMFEYTKTNEDNEAMPPDSTKEKIDKLIDQANSILLRPSEPALVQAAEPSLCHKIGKASNFFIPACGVSVTLAALVIIPYVVLTRLSASNDDPTLEPTPDQLSKLYSLYRKLIIECAQSLGLSDLAGDVKLIHDYSATIVKHFPSMARVSGLADRLHCPDVDLNQGNSTLGVNFNALSQIAQGIEDQLRDLQPHATAAAMALAPSPALVAVFVAMALLNFMNEAGML